MIQTKKIALILLIAIAAVGATAIGIGTAAQSAQAQFCRGGFGDPDDIGHGQSCAHDSNGDLHSNGHS